MSERAVRHVRKFLGQRVRTLRKQRGLSQERLGNRGGLSGEFIGEVERGEKSISIDSLYRVSVALEIPLRELTDVRADKPSAVPSESRLRLRWRPPRREAGCIASSFVGCAGITGGASGPSSNVEGVSVRPTARAWPEGEEAGSDQPPAGRGGQAPARQRRRTEAPDEVEGALLENEMEFASNAEYDAQLAQFYSRTISPGAVDNHQAKLFGWEREPSET